MSGAVAPLLAKELRQLGRSRGALASAALFPLLMLVLVPFPQLAGLSATASRVPEGFPMPPGLTGTDDPRQLFVALIYPLLVTIAGLIVPSMAATHAIVQERERRTLELLIALPVSIRQILTAKLLSLLVLAAIVVYPFFAIGATAMLVLGIAGALQIALLLVLLTGALICSTCIALMLSLLAKDFRTANNLSGALFLPIMMLTVAVFATVRGDVKLVVASVFMLIVGGTALFVAARWITFERYLE